MTRRLITDLSRVSFAGVVIPAPRACAAGAPYKSLAQIARELGVDAGWRPRCCAPRTACASRPSLVHIASDQNLWRTASRAGLEDVIDLQREVARSVAREVNAKLTPPERAPGQPRPRRSRGPREVPAREAHVLDAHAGPRCARRASTSKRSLARDPQNARALVGLADTQVILAAMAESAAGGRLGPRARRAARPPRSTSALAEAYSTQAYAAFVLDRDWAGADTSFKRALELNPNLSQAHEEYGWYLTARGKLDQGLVEMKRAKDLDRWRPRSTSACSRSTCTSASTRMRPASAAGCWSWSRRTRLGATRWPASTSWRAGRSKPSTSSRPSWPRTATPGSSRPRARLRVHRQPEQALRTLDRWRALKGTPEEAAHVYAALGDKQEAMRLLEQAYGERSPGLVWLKVDPRFEALGGEPRFADLLKRLGLAS